jgi:hypothetical protein
VCCLVRAIAHLWGGDRWIWSNGGMIYLQGKPKNSEKTCLVPLCPSQIPHGLTRARTRAYAVRGQRLTAWAMARPPKACSWSYMCTFSTYRFTSLSHGQTYSYHSSGCSLLWLSRPTAVVVITNDRTSDDGGDLSVEQSDYLTLMLLMKTSVTFCKSRIPRKVATV